MLFLYVFILQFGTTLHVSNCHFFHHQVMIYKLRNRFRSLCTSADTVNNEF
jgi:hypothetical protein